MASKHDENLSIGLLGSLLGHALLVYLIIFRLAPNVNAFNQAEVYSVTIEGGKNLGGISQLDKSKQKAPVAPPKKLASTAPPPRLSTPQSQKAQSSDAEKAEVSLAEKKKEEKPPEKKKAEPTKVEEKKTPAKPTPKKPEPKKTPSAAEINRNYQSALQRYLGESSDAGGKGFGAAAPGGKGMGGGIIRPPEFFTYRDLLKRQIKDVWRWYDTSAALVCTVTFEISPDGRISKVALVQSSGNSEYDASVVRAINKASPVSAPPPNVYQYFRAVRMSFDPRE